MALGLYIKSSKPSISVPWFDDLVDNNQFTFDKMPYHTYEDIKTGRDQYKAAVDPAANGVVKNRIIEETISDKVEYYTHYTIDDGSCFQGLNITNDIQLIKMLQTAAFLKVVGKYPSYFDPDSGDVPSNLRSPMLMYRQTKSDYNARNGITWTMLDIRDM